MSDKGDSQALLARVKELLREKSELEADVEALCKQNVPSSSISAVDIMAKMQSRRAAALEHELRTSKHKVTTLVMDCSDLQRELSEAYRAKGDMEDLWKAEAEKARRAESEVAFYQSQAAAALAQRDDATFQMEELAAEKGRCEQQLRVLTLRVQDLDEACQDHLELRETAERHLSVARDELEPLRQAVEALWACHMCSPAPSGCCDNGAEEARGADTAAAELAAHHARAELEGEAADGEEQEHAKAGPKERERPHREAKSLEASPAAGPSVVQKAQGLVEYFSQLSFLQQQQQHRQPPAQGPLRLASVGEERTGGSVAVEGEAEAGGAAAEDIGGSPASFATPTGYGSSEDSGSHRGSFWEQDTESHGGPLEEPDSGSHRNPLGEPVSNSGSHRDSLGEPNSERLGASLEEPEIEGHRAPQGEPSSGSGSHWGPLGEPSANSGGRRDFSGEPQAHADNPREPPLAENGGDAPQVAPVSPCCPALEAEARARAEERAVAAERALLRLQQMIAPALVDLLGQLALLREHHVAVYDEVSTSLLEQWDFGEDVAQKLEAEVARAQEGASRERQLAEEARQEAKESRRHLAEADATRWEEAAREREEERERWVRVKEELEERAKRAEQLLLQEKEERLWGAAAAAAAAQAEDVAGGSPRRRPGQVAGAGDEHAGVLAQAMHEKVAALLLVAQQEERHLMEAHTAAALQASLNELKTKLAQVASEKVQALMMVAQLKADMACLQDNKQDLERQLQQYRATTMANRMMPAVWPGSAPDGASPGATPPSAKREEDMRASTSDQPASFLSSTLLGGGGYFKGWLPTGKGKSDGGKGGVPVEKDDSFAVARLRVENASLAEAVDSMKHLTLSARHMRTALAQVENAAVARLHASSDPQGLSAAAAQIEAVLLQAHSLKLALGGGVGGGGGAQLPLSWPTPPLSRSDSASSCDTESKGERDAAAAAGLEFAELVVALAELQKSRLLSHRLSGSTSAPVRLH